MTTSLHGLVTHTGSCARLSKEGSRRSSQERARSGADDDACVALCCFLLLVLNLWQTLHKRSNELCPSSLLSHACLSACFERGSRAFGLAGTFRVCRRRQAFAAFAAFGVFCVACGTGIWSPSLQERPEHGQQNMPALDLSVLIHWLPSSVSSLLAASSPHQPLPLPISRPTHKFHRVWKAAQPPGLTKQP